jgi:Zn finger protein HypA/HybF involved in hydrogenase expression
MEVAVKLEIAIEKKLARGQVWCRECGRTQRTDSAEAMRHGWPKCCGYTMTIDSPEEQKRLAEPQRDARY